MPTRIVPYLIVPNALEAIEEYREVFGLEVIAHMPFTEEMGGMPEGFNFSKSTMHSSLKIGDAQFYMADDTTEKATPKGRVEMMLEPESMEQMQEIYNKAKEKGYEIYIELDKMFWGDYFTRFADRFGIVWQMNLSGDQ